MRCRICNHIMIGEERPERCPNCGAPPSAFEPAPRELLLAAEAGPAAFSRRKFFATWGWWGFCMSAAMTAIGSVRYFFPNDLYEPPAKYKVGFPNDFPIGEHVFIPAARAYVIHVSGGFKAITAICTHLGCTVKWTPDVQEFHCPCHGSMYRADGTRFAGPAPRNLIWLAVSLAPDGQVVIDTKPPRLVEPTEVFKG